LDSEGIQSDQPHEVTAPENATQIAPKTNGDKWIPDWDKFAPPARNHRPPLPKPKPSPRIWTCQFFPNQNCGIVNDVSTGDLFHLESHQFSGQFDWPKWYLVLNTSTIPPNTVGGRLV